MRTRDLKTQIVDMLLDAYRHGAFPMADPDTGFISFYTALRRGVFPLEPGAGFRVPASLRRVLNSDRFIMRADTAFEEVMRACAEPRRDEPKSWISETLIGWYMILFRAGHAHCVEAWARHPVTGEERLVGGIYGVSLGGAFFGESMFCRTAPRTEDGSRDPFDGTDASKVCLVRLVDHLRGRGYTLFDTQLNNPHLDRFGCAEISSREYSRRLALAVAAPVTWGAFDVGPRGEI